MTKFIKGKKFIHKLFRGTVVFLIVFSWVYSDILVLMVDQAIVDKMYPYSFYDDDGIKITDYGDYFMVEGVPFKIPKTHALSQIDVVLTTGTGQQWSLPADWSDTNIIHVIGAGGGGGGGGVDGGTSVGGGGGGAGGAYVTTSNLAGLSDPVDFRVGSAGTGGPAGSNGVVGGDTWFNGTTCGGATVCAGGGDFGDGATATTGGAGGAAGTPQVDPDTTGNNGGAGGTGGDQSGNGKGGGGGGGGGGAAGANGVGGSGAVGTTHNSGGDGGGGGEGDGGNNGSGTTGGSGGSATGGDGGAGAVGGAGSNGSAGTGWTDNQDADGTAGPGGGGGGGAGGGNNSNGFAAGTGGNYGAGGGGGGGAGANGTSSAGNDGTQGVLIIEWEPAVTKAASLLQHAYRWYKNENSVTPGGPAGPNSPTQAPQKGVPFRLRLLLVNEGGTSITTGAATTSDLQVALRDSDGVCDGDESYTSLSPSSGDIRFYNNSSPADGANISTISFDPRASSSAVTIQPQDYEEANTFSNTQNDIAENEAGLWDFALVDFSAPPGTTYCFRGVQDDGGTNFVYSGGYDVFPEITTQKEVSIRLRGTIRLRLVRLR